MAIAVGASAMLVASSSNSVTASISVPIEMLVTRSRMTSITTGTLNSAIQRLACSIAGISSCLHADELAAQALDDLLVVDAITLAAAAR